MEAKRGHLLLEGTHDLLLLILVLEAAVTELRGGIDELEGDLLLGPALGGSDDGLAESDDTLLDTRDGALEHHEVLLDDTKVREATHGGDGLLGEVELGGTAILGRAVANAVDLLVDLGAVVISVLTGTGDGPADTRRVPRSNAGDLSETLMRLAREAASTPASSDALEALTLGDSNGIHDLILLEDGVYGDLLLKEAICKGNLIGNVTTVDLDLEDVGLLLAEVDLADLRVGNDAHNAAVFGDAGELALDRLLALGVGELLGVLGEGFLLGAVPVLQERR